MRDNPHTDLTLLNPKVRRKTSTLDPKARTKQNTKSKQNTLNTTKIPRQKYSNISNSERAQHRRHPRERHMPACGTLLVDWSSVQLGGKQRSWLGQ